MRLWLPAALAALLGALGTVTADDTGKKFTDPVSGKEVTVAKETPVVVVNRQRLYFTDKASREAFLKAPETYLKTPLECPVRGLKGRASKANRLVVNDQILYFCCTTHCVPAFQKEPGNFLSILVDPVNGSEFGLGADSPKVTYKGSLYYFESDDSKAAFEKDPAKYAKVVLQP